MGVVLRALLVGLALLPVLPAAADEPTYADKPISFWIDELAESDTAGIATQVLRRMGQDAVPALGDALRTEDAALRKRALHVLAKLEDGDYEPILPHLAYALRVTKGSTRTTVVQLVGRIGPPAARLLPQLVPLLDARDGRLRRAALWAVPRLGGKAALAVDAIAAQLADGKTRVAAARSLGQLGPAAKPALPQLIVVTRGLEGPVLVPLVEAMLAIDRDDPEVRSLLFGAARGSDDPKVRWKLWRLAEKLPVLRDEELEWAAQALHDDAPGVSVSVAKVLHDAPVLRGDLRAGLASAFSRGHGRMNYEHLTLLTERLGDDDVAALLPDLVRLIGRIGYQDDVGRILAAHPEHSVPVLVEAVQGGEGNGVALCTVLVRMPVEAVEGHVEVLGGLLLDPETDARLRTSLLRVLSTRRNSRTPVAGAAPILERLLADPDTRLAAWAASALFAHEDGKDRIVVAYEQGDVALRRSLFRYASALRENERFKQALVDSLGDEDAQFRQDVAFVLLGVDSQMGQARPYANDLMAVLLEIAEGDDPSLAMRAIRGLEQVGGDTLRAIPVLERQLRSGDYQRAATAGSVLCAFGRSRFADDVTPVLERALVADSSVTRVAAAHAWVALKQDYARVREDLVTVLLETDRPEVLRGALHLVAQHAAATPEAEERVVALLRVADVENMDWVALAVAAYAQTSHATRKALFDAVRDEQYPARASAIGVLGQLGADSLPVMVELLDDPAPAVPRLALEQIVRAVASGTELPAPVRKRLNTIAEGSDRVLAGSAKRALQPR